MNSRMMMMTEGSTNSGSHYSNGVDGWMEANDDSVMKTRLRQRMIESNGDLVKTANETEIKKME